MSQIGLIKRKVILNVIMPSAVAPSFIVFGQGKRQKKKDKERLIKRGKIRTVMRERARKSEKE